MCVQGAVCAVVQQSAKHVWVITKSQELHNRRLFDTTEVFSLQGAPGMTWTLMCHSAYDQRVDLFC